MKIDILDELKHIIELRVHQIYEKNESEKGEQYKQEYNAHVKEISRILKMLPEDERELMDNYIFEQFIIVEKEMEHYYKAGLADAIELLNFLKK